MPLGFIAESRAYTYLAAVYGDARALQDRIRTDGGWIRCKRCRWREAAVPGRLAGPSSGSACLLACSVVAFGKSVLRWARRARS